MSLGPVENNRQGKLHMFLELKIDNADHTALDAIADDRMATLAAIAGAAIREAVNLGAKASDLREMVKTLGVNIVDIGIGRTKCISKEYPKEEEPNDLTEQEALMLQALKRRGGREQWNKLTKNGRARYSELATTGLVAIARKSAHKKEVAVTDLGEFMLQKFC